MVWGTIAAGVGNNSVQLTIDGGLPNITSMASNGTAVFNFVYFETPLLTETYHTAVVTNLGSIANGSSEFELDRFSFETSDITPLFSPPTSQTLTQTQSVLSATASPSATASASSAKSSSKSPLGSIAGAVIGTLVLVIILLLYFLWRRKKPAGATNGTFLKHALLHTADFTLFRPYPTTSNTLSIESPVPDRLYCCPNYSKVPT